LVTAQEKILGAAHLVFVFPTWWGSFPAVLKGFLDRCFLSGFAYRFEKGKALPVQLLKGRTGRILVTMDAPTFYYRWFLGAPGVSAIRGATLKFCGVKMLGTTLLGQIQSRSPEQLARYLERGVADGKKDGLRIGRA
jgi:putative NADPH-quinone reductase